MHKISNENSSTRKKSRLKSITNADRKTLMQLERFFSVRRADCSFHCRHMSARHTTPNNEFSFYVRTIYIYVPHTHWRPFSARSESGKNIINIHQIKFYDVLFALSQILDHVYWCWVQIAFDIIGRDCFDGHEMSNDFICHLISSRIDVIEIDLSVRIDIEYLRPTEILFSALLLSTTTQYK